MALKEEMIFSLRVEAVTPDGSAMAKGCCCTLNSAGFVKEVEMEIGRKDKSCPGSRARVRPLLPLVLLGVCWIGILRCRNRSSQKLRSVGTIASMEEECTRENSRVGKKSDFESQKFMLGKFASLLNIDTLTFGRFGTHF